MSEAIGPNSRKARWCYPGKNPLASVAKGPLNVSAVSQLERAIGSPQIGEEIATRFNLKEQLGRGGMSIVYRAFDQVKQCDVALKFLSPALMGDSEATRSFELEARISMQLNHPNILKVFDLQIHQGVYFLVMELMDRGTLRDWITERLSHQTTQYHERCRILRDLAQALVYAHEHTIHRDLKPENIAFTQEGTIKVMDFGLSTLTNQHQTILFREAVTQLIAGTPYYIAPELVSGESPGTVQSDQFSLGVIAYELFSGRIPMGLAPSLADQCPRLPRKLTQTVDRMLALQPRDRFPSVEEICGELDQALRLAPSNWHQIRRVTRAYSGTLITVGVCTLLAIGSLAGIAHWKGEQERTQNELTSAWTDLAHTRAELGNLTGIIQDKRNALAFLQAQAMPRYDDAPLQSGEPTIDQTAFIPAELQTAKSLWQWLGPKTSPDYNWLEIEELFRQARASLAKGQIDQSTSLIQLIQQRSKEVEETIEAASEAFHLHTQAKQLYENLVQLQTEQADAFKLMLESVASLILDEQWTLASSQLIEEIHENELHLQGLYDTALSRFADSQQNWDNLFGDLGTPDLSFIADPRARATEAISKKDSGQTAEAIRQLTLASTVYQQWTDEVTRFDNQAADTLPANAITVNSKGVELVSMGKLCWSRWEIRVLDFARWVAEENKLSQESAAFWKNPGYPIGPTHPVVGISRRDAKEFSAWLGYNLTRFGRPIGRLPTQSEWQNLLQHEGIQAERPFGIFASRVQWQSGHFREHYADLEIDPKPFLFPDRAKQPSPSGLFGLFEGVWEWTGSYYAYGKQMEISDQGLKWLLAGGGNFGTVAYNAFPPPEPELRFVLRKEGIGFRPVIVVNDHIKNLQ